MASTGGTDGGPTGSDESGSPGARTRVRRVAGALALLAVPVLLAAVPLVPVTALLGPAALDVVGPGAIGGFIGAVVVGLGGSALLGADLVDRRIARLPEAELDDAPRTSSATASATLAEEVGV
ncbi:hypothetical protein FK85_30710, partial [Halorubrum saccharovorum]